MPVSGRQALRTTALLLTAIALYLSPLVLISGFRTILIPSYTLWFSVAGWLLSVGVLLDVFIRYSDASSVPSTTKEVVTAFLTSFFMTIPILILALFH
jgi:hypothetical protein